MFNRQRGLKGRFKFPTVVQRTMPSHTGVPKQVSSDKYTLTFLSSPVLGALRKKKKHKRVDLQDLHVDLQEQTK